MKSQSTGLSRQISGIAFLIFANLPSYSNAEESAPQTPVSLIEASIVANECFDKVDKPFKTFKSFGLGSDGKFYGLKNGTLLPLSILPDQIKYKEEAPSEIDAQKTLVEFKERTKIAKKCNGSDPSEGQNLKTKKPSKAHPIIAGCDVANQADSYVLAMSWQPAFCETMKDRPDKVECFDPAFVDKNKYHATKFTLHGLWPNKKECGINYGSCNKVPDGQSSDNLDLVKIPDATDPRHINPLGFSTKILPVISMVMPSVGAGSGLEVHEWNKHGRCQARSRDNYFLYATDLVLSFNTSPFVEYIGQNIGKSITKEELLSKLDASFGEGSREHFIFICNKKDMLTEIQIPLKKDLPEQAPIGSLIDQNAKGYFRGCPVDGIKIDEIGFNKETGVTQE